MGRLGKVSVWLAPSAGQFLFKVSIRGRKGVDSLAQCVSFALGYFAFLLQISDLLL